MIPFKCHGAVLKIHAADHEILAEAGLYFKDCSLHALRFRGVGGIREQIELSELLVSDVAAGDIDTAYGALRVDYPVI